MERMVCVDRLFLIKDFGIIREAINQSFGTVFVKLCAIEHSAHEINGINLALWLGYTVNGFTECLQNILWAFRRRFISVTAIVW